jgi:hypothetical protein
MHSANPATSGSAVAGGSGVCRSERLALPGVSQGIGALCALSERAAPDQPSPVGKADERAALTSTDSHSRGRAPSVTGIRRVELFATAGAHVVHPWEEAELRRGGRRPSSGDHAHRGFADRTAHPLHARLMTSAFGPSVDHPPRTAVRALRAWPKLSRRGSRIVAGRSWRARVAPP